MLGNVRANLSVAIEETGALVTNDSLPMVPADAGQLGQLFQNLIGNGDQVPRTERVRDVHVSARRDARSTGNSPCATTASASRRSTSTGSS